MKNNTFRRYSVVLLCASMAMFLFGCGSSEDYGSDTAESISGNVESYTAESGQEAAETTDVVFFNNSGKDIELINVMPLGGSYMAVDVTDGEGLPDSCMLFASLEKIDGNYMVDVYADGEEMYDGVMPDMEWDLNNNGLMIFPAEYAGDAMVYPGTDDDLDDALAVIEEALTSGNSAGSSSETGDSAADKAEVSIDPDEEMVTAFLNEQGFDGTLEMYRILNHDSLTYDVDSDDMVAWPELIGYWYPEGNQGSFYYYSVDENGTVTYWQFSQNGDEDVYVTAVASKDGNRYTLKNGQIFTLKADTDLFYDNSEIVFDDSDIVYHISVD